MQWEKRSVTSPEYHNAQVLAPGWIIIEKDSLTSRFGKIFISRGAMENSARYSASGVVVVKSVIPPEDRVDKMMWDSVEVGTRVGFNPSTPIEAPCPVNWTFDQSIDVDDGFGKVIKEKVDDTSMCMHVGDIINIIAEGEEKAAIEQRMRDSYYGT